jgi:hypothetical protein
LQILFLILLTLPSWSAPTKNIQEAKQSIKALIRPLIPGTTKARPKGTEKFRVDACEKHKINWMEVLMMKKSVTLEYEFKPGCDIQGSITPMVLKPFPAVLELRNLASYKKVESQNKITASLESRPIMNLEMREGTLFGQIGKVKFEADYSVQINPLRPKSPVHKNLGGELRITEINGLKVSINEKIMVE